MELLFDTGIGQYVEHVGPHVNIYPGFYSHPGPNNGEYSRVAMKLIGQNMGLPFILSTCN
jgi:hypothetical protein